MLKSLCKKSQASPAVEIWKRASTGRREKGKSHSAKLLTDPVDSVSVAPDLLLLFYLLLFCKYLSNPLVSHHFVAGKGEVSNPQRLLLPPPTSGMPRPGPRRGSDTPARAGTARVRDAGGAPPLGDPLPVPCAHCSPSLCPHSWQEGTVLSCWNWTAACGALGWFYAYLVCVKKKNNKIINLVPDTHMWLKINPI